MDTAVWFSRAERGIAQFLGFVTAREISGRVDPMDRVRRFVLKVWFLYVSCIYCYLFVPFVVLLMYIVFSYLCFFFVFVMVMFFLFRIYLDVSAMDFFVGDNSSSFLMLG